MKKLLSALAFAACALTVPAVAQGTGGRHTDANLIGHVVDARSGEHLPYITVVVRGTTIGATTDETGHFYLKNLPLGEVTVEARAIGYRTETHMLRMRPDHTAEVNFTLVEEAQSVDEVVVEVDRARLIRESSPSLVKVLDSGLFDRTGSVCLADGLNFQPGVRVEDGCQNCGFAQVRINGLDGHYAQILLDSHPVFSALNGVYGLEQIPSGMIDRVEVIRGGGSALVGASAIGGTINIITRDPSRNSAEAGHTLRSIGRSGALDNNTSLGASLVTDNRRAGLYLYAQSRRRAAYDHDGDGFTELPELRGATLGMRSFVRTGERSRLTLEYHRIGEFRRGGDRLDLPAHESAVTEQTDHAIDGAGIHFDLYGRGADRRLSLYVSAQHTARKSYYGGSGDGSEQSAADALRAYGRTEGLTVVGGAHYRRTFDRLLFLPSELTAGIEYTFDDIDDRTTGYGLCTRQTVHAAGAVLQNEWRSDKWSFLVGGRLDRHGMVGHLIFSPRVNLRFDPSPGVNLRLSYAGGFRAPQTFDEDLHIALVGGERVVTRLADGLREEHSNSVSASADWRHTFGRVPVSLLVEGFYTDLKDVFATRYLDEPDEHGETVMERYNGSGARVAGINVEAGAALARWFDLQMGLTWQRSRYREPQEWSESAAPERRMFRTPDCYGYLTAGVRPLRRLAVDLSGTYTGRMLVQHVAGSGLSVDTAVETPRFFALDLKASYDFLLGRGITLRLSAGVQNLFDSYQDDFDTGYDRDSGYVYGPSLPRSWSVGAKLSF